MNGALYLDHRNLALSLEGQALRIHQDGVFQRSIPLDLLEHIVCQASVNLDTSLLANLAHQGVGLTLFGGRHGQYSAHLGVSGTQDVTRRLGQYQYYLDPQRRLEWSCRLIAHKLQRQLRLLLLARKRRPDLRLTLTSHLVPIRRQLDQLRSDPPRSLDTLRGIEGSASHAYFQAYASLIPEGLGFHGRQRRPPPDPVNALLSLGYTLLYGDVQQAVESVGLDPWLGIYHEPAHGRASLVCDLVEPVRPRIDLFVWQLLRERVLEDRHFSLANNACLLNKEGRALFYPGYESRARALRPLLRRVMLRVADAMQKGVEHNAQGQYQPMDGEEIPF